MKYKDFTDRCIQNRYLKIYTKICRRAHERGWDKKTAPCYVEMHHVVPKSIIPNDKMVALTAKEHLICHLLLTKFTIGEDKAKMVYAAANMMNYDEYGRNGTSSRLYESLREEHAKNLSERMTGRKIHWSDKINKNPEKIRKTAEKHRGMKRSEETRKNISESRKGKPTWNKGLINTIQKGHKKVVVECPHCGMVGGKPVMTRFHFDNCKDKKEEI